MMAVFFVGTGRQPFRDYALLIILHYCPVRSCRFRRGFFVGMHRLAIRDWHIVDNLTSLPGSFLLVSAGFFISFFRKM